MKTSIQIFFFVITIWQISTAQNVFPSFADAPSWQVANIGNIEAKTTTFAFERDTMICGVLYSVITLWENTPVYVLSNSVKTIYKYEPDCNAADYVLYDYSLNEGMVVQSDFSRQFTILETDSVTLFGVTRKRLKVDSDFGEMYWIEGIGSTFHPFFAMLGNIADDDQNYVLLCYHEGAEQFYQSEAHQNCSLDYQIPNTYFYLNIFPNPFQNKTAIQIEMVDSHEVYLEIYSPFGQFIESYHSESGAFHHFEIGENLHSNGVYFVKIRIDGAIYTTKILRWR